MISSVACLQEREIFRPREGRGQGVVCIAMRRQGEWRDDGHQLPLASQQENRMWKFLGSRHRQDQY